jgi:ABC-2 type transport system ATP-binding protein
MDHGKLLLERSLSELQGGTVKVLVALPEGEALPEGLPILHESSTGRMHTLIVRADAEAAAAMFADCRAQYLDVVPLNLEEVFIYELGGADYAVKDILL